MRPDLNNPAEFETEVNYELGVLRVRDEAKRRIAAEDAPKRLPLKELTPAELYALTPPDYLVDELIPSGALGEVIGDSETLKSFLMISLGLSIATGCRTFFGKAITRCGPVLYICAEGAGAFQYRMRAWAKQHNVTVDGSTPFHTIIAPMNLRESSFQEELREIVIRLKPVLIIVDTLHRVIPGADENSSRDLGEVVGYATRLQAENRAAVMFLHHPPKSDPSGRGRGSSSLYYAADTELSCVLEGDEQPDGTKFIRVSVKKQKDDAKTSFLVKNKIVNILNDDGRVMANSVGRPITSCVLVEATEEELANASNAKSDQGTKKLLDFITAHPGCTKGEIRTGVAMKANTLSGAVDQLMDERRITKTSNGRRDEYRIAPPNAAGVAPTIEKPAF